MTNTMILIGIAILILIWANLWISIRIIAYLKEKGEDASLFTNRMFIKGKIFSYLPLYKKISEETDGKTGPLYYAFYGSFLLFMLLLLIAIILLL